MEHKKEQFTSTYIYINNMSRATITTTTTKQAGKILEWKELNKFIQTKKKDLINGQTNPQSRIRLFNKTEKSFIDTV